ncbi:MAG: thioredoxin-like domain-containing protein [Armatimonadota bacterium]
MRGTIHAPEFPADASWLNVPEPLSLRALRGKIVLLDFWTFCCINCIHVIPELRRLEERFADVLVVIGVHAAKYTYEQNLENVRQAAMRYGVRHPVVNDPYHAIWDDYAISAWPTTALVDPDGYLAGVHPGEFEAEDYSQVIEQMIAEYGDRLDRTPLPLTPEERPTGPLSYPGKVLVDGERLFIADTEHNRILEADLDGMVRQVIGSGKRGMIDGPAEIAAFDSPQGMAVAGETLFVADTENHAVRRINLSDGRVETIAGTGEQARLFRRGGPALLTELSSPWDLALADGSLYVAMAGNHTIWRIDGDEAHKVIGTGREALSDGTLERCALAQTSGLSLAGDLLYFADSETSSVRCADLAKDAVRTIVGAGLFDFGDRDGTAEEVRLQHCLGVAERGGLLYVADSYNSKIKVIDPKTRTCRTLAGSKAGFMDGSPGRFWEPGGLSVGELIYVADTNNHAVRTVDPESGTVGTITISL